MNWDDITVAALHRMIDEGMTASNIGRKLGCTRNAVIGKATREGRRFDVSFWTPERVEQLAKLVAEGLTSVEIAAVMGNTRSAVLGKAAILKIRFRGAPGSRQRPPKPSKAPGSYNHGGGLPQSTGPKPPSIAKTKGPVKGSLNIRMWDPAFTSRSCAWPTMEDGEGHLFCGLRRLPEGPYCKGHSIRTPVLTPLAPPKEDKARARPAKTEDDGEPKPLDFERAA